MRTSLHFCVPDHCSGRLEDRQEISQMGPIEHRYKERETVAEFKMVVEAFGWQAILDIFLVTVLIYQLLMLIKGTRAVQLINGLIVFLIVSFVVSKAGLTMVNWLLNQATTMLVVALPIVFQPELRRMLEKLGRGKFITMHTNSEGPEEYKKLIEELVKCAQLLSQRRIGALIVLEKNTGIQEFVETGVKIDGIVSSEFLVNIFIHNSPLHDGAVILRGSRVAAAGCFLPLTQSPNLQKDLGTRHRAAIGISEVSDALVIVVSEETGIISVAQHGHIQRYFDEKNLRDLLKNELLLPKTVSYNPFRRQ